jgi:hypothetical protein
MWDFDQPMQDKLSTDEPIEKSVDRDLFLTTLVWVVPDRTWIYHASSCPMTNHSHLLVTTPEGNLSAGMRQLNVVSIQHFQ